MGESERHRQLKNKAAGRTGQTEVPIQGGRRLDAATKSRAIEVERSGNRGGLLKAAKRLELSGRPQKVLQVPQKDMTLAVEAMKGAGTKGTVKNLGGTKRRSVR